MPHHAHSRRESQAAKKGSILDPLREAGLVLRHLRGDKRPGDVERDTGTPQSTLHRYERTGKIPIAKYAELLEYYGSRVVLSRGEPAASLTGRVMPLGESDFDREVLAEGRAELTNEALGDRLQVVEAAIERLKLLGAFEERATQHAAPSATEEEPRVRGSH